MKIKFIAFWCIAFALVILSHYASRQYKDITFCGVNPNDCLTFTIPEEYPDFVNEFEHTTLCFGAGMFRAQCIWHDGDPRERTEDGYPVGVRYYYRMIFWSGTLLADCVPISLQIDDFHEPEKSRYYVYDDKKNLEEKTEYEYAMYYYDIDGYPRVTEEEYYLEKERVQKEWDEFVKEQEEKETKEALGQKDA